MIHRPILASFVILAACAAPPPETASRRIVAVIDASGSFKTRQGEAVERLQQLLDQLGAEKLHRWDDDADRISIVALDAMPQVVWSGGQRDLATLAPADWRAWFAARTDYASCTDVGAAFRQALPLLRPENAHTDRYLFVFSDLVDEPPLADDVRRCRRPSLPSGPPPDVPWEELAGVQVVGFWLPPNQVRVWGRSLLEHGIEGAQLLSTSQSGAVPVFAPPRATVDYSDAELDRQRAHMVARAGGVARTAGIVLTALLGLGLLAMAGAAVAARRLGRRRAEAWRTARSLAATAHAPGPPGGQARPPRAAGTRRLDRRPHEARAARPANPSPPRR